MTSLVEPREAHPTKVFAQNFDAHVQMIFGWIARKIRPILRK